MPIPPPQEFMTLGQLFDWLKRRGFNETWTRRQIDKGFIPIHRYAGRRRYFNAEEVEEFLRNGAQNG